MRNGKSGLRQKGNGMVLLVRNGMVYRDGRFSKEDILIEDGIIREVGNVGGEPSELRDICGEQSEQCETAAETGLLKSGKDSNILVLDVGGQRVVPGFIDIHTHGAVNVDVNGATAEDLERICRFFASQGTTSWLCSILTDTREQTLWCIEQYRRWKQLDHKGAALEGIHLEGPFLASDYKGAMPEHLLRRADMPILKEYQEAAEGDIRYITVSPEVEGIPEMIPEIKKMGIQVAIGHSGADYETSRKAIEKGAMAATHVGNAMKLLHQHFPSIFGAVLEAEKVYAEIICDGRHLHPGTVRFIIKCKGLDRVVAITDSIMASGLPDGNYKLGVNDVVVENGDAKLASNGVRAGSTLTMGQALKNLLEFTGRPLEEVLPVLTENPAKLVGMYDQVGSIEKGKRANLVFLNQTNDVIRTMVDGEIC